MATCYRRVSHPASLSNEAVIGYRSLTVVEKERRRSVRIKKPLEIIYSADSPPLAARVEDLSETGIFVETTDPLSMGSRIEFALHLPDQAADEPIRGEGIVAWTDPATGTGIEFRDLSSEDRERIRWFVAAEYFGVEEPVAEDDSAGRQEASAESSESQEELPKPPPPMSEESDEGRLKLQHWDTVRDGPPTEEALQARLEQRGYRVSRHVYPPGAFFPEHVHQVDKIDAVVSGQFLVRLGDVEVLLEPGDLIPIPRGVFHSAEVVGEEPVVSLDGIKE
jgi:mannose-6-phosphate isomerase-like protein (cupin superfamily)/Tfp pilus assembly protein PilZ